MCKRCWMRRYENHCNIYFCLEIRKSIFDHVLLSGGLTVVIIVMTIIVIHKFNQEQAVCPFYNLSQLRDFGTLTHISLASFCGT